jgi:dTDP-4-amino-4,6-dideoxygalactose transaminase
MVKINVTRSSLPPFGEYTEEIKELWESRWLTNMGVKHRQLEEKLKNYLGVTNITLFTNGHLALESVLTAMEIKGEVITTPFTFASTTHAITRCGAEPVFCDIKDTDYTIDVFQIEKLITERTTAIVPVHVYGNICDCEQIAVIAEKYNLKVIYDAAHAFGEKLGEFGVASLGDASMFSFHATKVFNTIEGGAVTYGDFTLSEKLDLTKNFGIKDQKNVPLVGGNAKMNEFQAAMGLCNLRHIDEYILSRRLAFERYNERLAGVKGIKLVSGRADVKSNYAYYPVVFDGYKYSRDEIFDKLAVNDVYARKYFYPPTNSFGCYDFDPDKTPTAKYISARVLTLPLYEGLSVADVDRICEIILK